MSSLGPAIVAVILTIAMRAFDMPRIVTYPLAFGIGAILYALGNLPGHA